MSPMVPIGLAVLASILAGAAVFLDFYGHGRRAVIVGVLALATFALMIAALQGVNWGNMPAYDPETCVETVRLDGRWTCIPREEAG